MLFVYCRVIFSWLTYFNIMEYYFSCTFLLSRYEYIVCIYNTLSHNLYIPLYFIMKRKWRMVSSGLLRRVALVLTRATRRNNREDTILHSHRRENLKSYMKRKVWNMYFICKIWGFHSGDYEEWCLLGCYAVWLL
jgi:hypothetical protein